MRKGSKRGKLKDVDLLPKVGEVAVITGGARGIGVEVVKKLLQCGIHVVIGCRNVEAGELVKKVIKSRGTVSGEVTCFQLDVGSFKSIKTFAALVLERFPRIDLLVNNAEVWRTKTRLISVCCRVGSSCTSNVSQDSDSHLKVEVQSTPESSYIELTVHV